MSISISLIPNSGAKQAPIVPSMSLHSELPLCWHTQVWLEGSAKHPSACVIKDFTFLTAYM